MKIRKLTALVLALALLALPVLSLGESAPASVLDKAMGAGRSAKTTVTFEPGDMLAQDPSLVPVKDLLKALRLETVTQMDAGALLLQADVFLQDKPSLSFTEVVEQGQFHLKTNLFGDKALSFTPEEYVQFLVTQLEMQGADQGMIAFYKAYAQFYASLMKGEMPKLPEFDPESLQQDLVMPVTEWFTSLMSAPEVTTGTFESDKHDAASMKMVYSLSASQIADLLTIVTNWAGKDVNLDTLFTYISSLNLDMGDLDGARAELQEALKIMPEEFLKEAAPAMPEPFTITTWMDSAYNMVAMEVNARFFGEDKEKPESTILAGVYTKTEADGADTRITFDVISGTDAFAFALATREAAGQSGDQWHVTVDVKQMGMDVFGMKLDYAGQQEASGTSVKDSWKLSAEITNFGQVTGFLLDNTMSTAPNGADIKADGKLNVYLTGQSAPVASVLYTTTTGEPVEIPDFSEDGVRLGKMTVEELQAWYQEVSTNMMMQMGQIMQNLPPSLLSTMNGDVTY